MDSEIETGVYDLLAELVAMPSESRRPADINNCFNYLENYLSNYDFQLHRHESNGFPSLMVTTQITKRPKILLQAHLDVVPGKTESYAVTERDNKLYGRGVYDMKFAAACYLQLVHDLRDSLGDYDFGLMLTSDEEVGGEDGVGYLLEQGYGAEVCLLPDGGNDWQIETTSNGLWMIKLVAAGKTAHGSRPWEGRNAINNLVEGLSEIQSLFGELKPHKSSVTISQISGGEAINQVPDHAEATVDMRFVSAADYDDYRQAIELIAKTQHLTITTEAAVAASTIDMTQPAMTQFLDIAAEVRGQPLGTTHSFGATDARFFAAQNIPVIILRPTGGGHHSDDEWLDKAEFFKFYELLKAYVTRAGRKT
jgi:succinyl-diaminopimelate desuccinylase